MSSNAELRSLKRKVPPERRQRVEMSCDYCKMKRCKCSRSSTSESCRACNEVGRPCSTTVPRKPKTYYRIPRIPESPQQFVDPAINDFNSQLSSDYPLFIYQPVTSANAHETVPRTMPLEPIERHTEWTSIISQKRGSRPISVEDIFEDSMGLPRYIGPTGTFAFMCRLRQIGAVKNAPETAQTMGHSTQLYNLNGGKTIDLPPRPVADMLVELFFTKVHPDWPTFHRAVFQASYEGMWSFIPETEPSWLMILSMVFLFGLEASERVPVPIPGLSEADRTASKQLYHNKVKELLPDVMFGCTLTHVQALTLYCHYLYISGERNSSWNLAGLAIRIAIAIGLHRNGVNAHCSPLERELRKRVWWSLFVFERIECSSLGRASAIDDSECNVGVPTEGLLDMGDYIPLGYIDTQSQLLILLGTICKAQYTLDYISQEQIDFAITLFNSLETWLRDVPSHLKLESEPPRSHRRAIINLYIQYHYVITLLGRRFLEATATKRHLNTSDPSIITAFAKRCATSAQITVTLSQKLFRFNMFNSTTSFDVYFLKSAAMMLALAIRADQDLDIDKDEVLKSLKNCIYILNKCGQFSLTMEMFANITTEFVQVLLDTDSPSPQGEQGSDTSTSTTGYSFL